MVVSFLRGVILTLKFEKPLDHGNEAYADPYLTIL